MEQGYIHSYQSLGTVDGPGVRFIVYMQGCPLRCLYCHNPDTWETEQYAFTATPEEVTERAMRYREYFGDQGGITVSGGEALLQASFVKEVFTLCKEQGIHTCLDTSGCMLQEEIRQLLAVTDLVLLDIKMTTEELYQNYTKSSLAPVLRFLEELDKRNIPTWIRQVILPGVNDCEDNAKRLKEILNSVTCVEKVEFLPFKKLCMEKYERLGIPFAARDYEEGTQEMIAQMEKWMAQQDSDRTKIKTEK